MRINTTIYENIFILAQDYGLYDVVFVAVASILLIYFGQSND